jgi:hypothetical protein
MTEGSIFRDSVRERDLDNFLVEELQASTSFRDWFLSRLTPYFAEPTSYEARLHKSPPRQDRRQTDVQIGWFDEHEKLRACVLIESKVAADFQTEQPEAYRREVDRCRGLYGPTSACSVLVAPEQRLKSLAGKELFDVIVSIEELIYGLTQRRVDGVSDPEIDARLAVRIQLLEALCGKGSGSQWVPLTISEKRNFANAYADLAKLILPNLKVRPSTDGPKAITRFFDGLNFERDFPCKVSLKHEFGNGIGVKYANIQFSGSASKLQTFREESSLFKDTPCYPTDSGKALFVRIDTPALLPVGEQFESQRDRIIAGLEAIGVLARWFEQHQTRLKAMLST